MVTAFEAVISTKGAAVGAQNRRRVGFFPRDVVEDFETKLLHRVADAENDVVRAGHP